MNLRQLRTLVHIGELGSLSKAADRAVSAATLRAAEMIKKEVAEMVKTGIWIGLPL